MIDLNIDKFMKEFKLLVEKIDTRFKEMVLDFSYKAILVTAVNETPYGELNEKTSRYYNDSRRLRYLPPVPGTAKGGWVVSINQRDDELFPGRALGEGASNIKSKGKRALSDFKLGDMIFIQNNVPYMIQAGWVDQSYGSIEGGYSAQAPDGVFRPTMQYITSVYKLKLNLK